MEKYRVFSGFSCTFGIGGPVHTLGVMYTGYKEKSGGICEKRGRLLYKCDEAQYKKLRAQIMDNTIIYVLGKKNENDIEAKKILKINVTPTPEEKEFLEKQAAPVTFTDEEFGEFVLDKSIYSFNGFISCQDRKIRVSLENKEDIETLRWIYRDLNNFLTDAAAYAAKKLLDLANDWRYSDDDLTEEEKNTPLTHKDFINRLALEAIDVSPDGEFSLWHGDGNMFFGHCITVYGDRANGFTDALMQG